jgi:hypothetical protein
VNECSDRLLGTPSDPTRALERSGEARLYTAGLKDGGSFRLVAFLRLPGNVTIGGTRYTSWKMPLMLSAGDSAEVSVTKDGRGSARFFRHHARSFGTLPYRTVLHACAADAQGETGRGVIGRRTGWAAAVITRQKALCLRLQVKDLASGVMRPLAVALGRACS